MIEENIKISNPTGLHTRPAKEVVSAAKNFESSITIFYKEKEASAKSLLKIMKLGIAQDQSILIRCEGSDEETALEMIKSVIQKLEG